MRPLSPLGSLNTDDRQTLELILQEIREGGFTAAPPSNLGSWFWVLMELRTSSIKLAGAAGAGASPKPYILHPTPYTLHPTPFTLHLSPFTLHPTPFTLHFSPYTLHPTPYTLYSIPYTLHPSQRSE